MSDITLPTEAEIQAIDESTFIWDDLLDGILTLEQGKVVKFLTDQVDADEVISIREAYSGTGKTANFVRENATNGNSFKIVTVDQFVDTYPYTGDYFENCENAPKRIQIKYKQYKRTSF